MNIIRTTLLASLPTNAAFTTRHGGVSNTPFTTNNLAFHVGDNSDDVIRNHDLLADIMGYVRERLVHMRQIHSDKIIQVDESFGFESLIKCDALITNVVNIPLMVMSADCTPILLYDPANHVIGAVHAGRAGALKKILPKTIQAMTDTFGTLAKEVLIVLGPSIHGCCYEINESIAREVKELGYPESLTRQNDKIFLDVNRILMAQLQTLHIPDEHIEVIDECTSCQNERYFSYRADKKQTGRIAGVIMLR